MVAGGSAARHDLFLGPRRRLAMLTGSCLCRGVRYEIRGTPQSMYHCHCAQCRKANGAMLATNVMVAGGDFVLTAGGELLGSFESSPGKRRYFCSVCGSPIYSHAEQTRHLVSVRSGTLDADPGLRPQAHVHIASKAPWMQIGDELPQFPGAAPRAASPATSSGSALQ
jgi:hypothetical protein